MRQIDLDQFQKLMTEVFECYSVRPPSAAALSHWIDALDAHPFSTVERVLRNWLHTQKKSPVIADIVKPCADMLSDSVESRAAADARAFVFKPEEWRGPTPFAEQCIAQMWAMLKEPKRPSKEWARKIMEDPNSSENQRSFAAPVYEKIRQRVPGEDDE